jgi:hypothetical protein
MIISVINHTHDQITDSELHEAIRAIDRQIEEDFEPYWSLGAKLRLGGKSTVKPTKQTLADMRGDAVLYLWDELDVDDALGYHDQNNRGIPYGFGPSVDDPQARPSGGNLSGHHDTTCAALYSTGPAISVNSPTRAPRTRAFSNTDSYHCSLA